MNLKTLKDMENNPKLETSVLTIRNIRSEAIKWVKEDIDEISQGIMFSAEVCVGKWMERLNITEDDLQ